MVGRHASRWATWAGPSLAPRTILSFLKMAKICISSTFMENDRNHMDIVQVQPIRLKGRLWNLGLTQSYSYCMPVHVIYTVTCTRDWNTFPNNVAEFSSITKFKNHDILTVFYICFLGTKHKI